MLSSVEFLALYERKEQEAGEALTTKKNPGVLGFPWKLEEDVVEKSKSQGRMERVSNKNLKYLGYTASP